MNPQQKIQQFEDCAFNLIKPFKPKKSQISKTSLKSTTHNASW